eukprot:7911493-Pyramimonas_sp.AAC.1
MAAWSPTGAVGGGADHDDAVHVGGDFEGARAGLLRRREHLPSVALEPARLFHRGDELDVNLHGGAVVGGELLRGAAGVDPCVTPLSSV